MNNIRYLDLDTLDPVVKKSVLEIVERSKAGIEKYGTTLAENNTDDFLQHLREELMDAVNYISKLQSMQNNTNRYVTTKEFIYKLKEFKRQGIIYRLESHADIYVIFFITGVIKIRKNCMSRYELTIIDGVVNEEYHNAKTKLLRLVLDYVSTPLKERGEFKYERNDD